MNRDELLERLRGHEWNDMEFKEALWAVPKSAYETVSAFANTSGGWLVFGVGQKGGQFEILGVIEVDKVQNDFLTVLHSRQKLNRTIPVEESLLQEDGKTLLVFHIPEVSRDEKPVYLDQDIRLSFIRHGGCDLRCSQTEIERFLRDASRDPYDGQTVELDPEQCYDLESVRWYRGVLYGRDSGHDQSLSDLEFLHHWGFVVESPGRLLPRRACILLFGTTPALLQILPRPVVDCQWINGAWSDGLPDQRWADRLVMEGNLIQSWRTLLDRYQQRTEKPFSVNPETLQRDDKPPDYIAFREATINLVIHQDYGDQGRTPLIQFFRDRTVLWNPGDAFGSPEQLLEPGEKEMRNPRIVAAFRRIGLSEQAGTGLRSIFRNWRRLGHVPPVIDNDRAGKCFRLSLVKDELLSQEQVLFQASLGVHLSQADAAAFALACRRDRLSVSDVKGVTDLPGPEAQAVLNRLVTQLLLERVEGTQQAHYRIAAHLRPALEARTGATDQAVVVARRLVSDQPPTAPTNLVTAGSRPLQKLSEIQWKIVMFCDIPRPMATIMEHLGMTHRTFFRRTHLEPLVQGSVLRMTYPNQPNHPEQSYVLTEAGAELKASRLDDTSWEH
jgi:ATP-dependent DNA helicase RecG